MFSDCRDGLKVGFPFLTATWQSSNRTVYRVTFIIVNTLLAE